MRWIIALGALVFAASVWAQDVGEIKTVKGTAHVEREGKKLPASAGMQLRQADTIVTGPDGAVGITFLDNSLFSAGPNSVLVINKYRFDTTTHAGEFDASLNKGSLAVVSGKMVKQSPESMRIRTPSSIMGVRGTEFVVKVSD
ncbi:MAG TPA: FecR domain-containing protein [Burkholderiales bacterium]|nr:FecR domain-containing protein [Burkholderiales bacterium]